MPLNEKATAGDQKLFDRLKGSRVTALLGNSPAGYGWRPVCKGIYLGNEVKATESAAVKYGEKLLADLADRVKAIQKVVRPKIQKLKKGESNNGTPRT